MNSGLNPTFAATAALGVLTTGTTGGPKHRYHAPFKVKDIFQFRLIKKDFPQHIVIFIGIAFT